MKSIKINLGPRSYEIIISKNNLALFAKKIKRLKLGDNPAIITFPILKRKFGSLLCRYLKSQGLNTKFFTVPDSERSKSEKVAFETINKIASFDRFKNIFIIAFGGGVIGDLAGFISAIYKRGIPYVQLPTTLVSQVDSSIGGKVAIDLDCGKNLAGAFYQPKLVFCELSFLKSLPEREIRGGLAEVIKYAAIKDPLLMDYIELNLKGIFSGDLNILCHIVSRCCQIKARIVEQDEYDKNGIRVILNYGHTIGHALERATEYSKHLTHGEAIALGMVVANQISVKLSLLRESFAERIKGLLVKCGLPITISGVTVEEIYKYHQYDKKFIHKKNRFVLLNKIGSAKIVENIPERVVKESIKKIIR